MFVVRKGVLFSLLNEFMYNWDSKFCFIYLFLCKDIGELIVIMCKVYKFQVGVNEFGVNCFQGFVVRKVDMKEIQNILRLKIGNG